MVRSGKWKVLTTTSSFNIANARDVQKLVDAGIEFVTNPLNRRLSRDDAVSLLDSSVIGLIAGVETLDENVLMAAPNLMVVSRCGTGIDNVDMRFCEKNGVAVYNTPNAPVLAVAELALGLILDGLRQISHADRLIRGKGWVPLMGQLLSNKTVGIVGFGRVGQKLAELLAPFNCTILAHDSATINSSVVNQVSFENLLQNSDIVSLHLPLDDNSRAIISSPELALMKPSAILVNASRGGLIDEKHLEEALLKREISWACIDCFEIEPYAGRLLELNNVTLTAHMGSYALECRSRQESEAFDNLLAGLASKGVL